MQRRLGCLLAVDDPLVEIGRPQAPRPGGEGDVVAVVHLGQVVEGAGLLWKGQDIGPSPVRDLDEPFLDVDVGRAVLAHGSQLDQVDVRIDLGDGVEEVEGPHDVVDLGVDGVGPVDHRVRSAALLREVHHRIGPEVRQRRRHEVRADHAI